jgi:hypothetical protein
MGFDHIREKTDDLPLLHKHAFLESNTKSCHTIIVLAVVILNMHEVNFKDVRNFQIYVQKPNAP